MCAPFEDGGLPRQRKEMNGPGKAAFEAWLLLRKGPRAQPSTSGADTGLVQPAAAIPRSHARTSTAARHGRPRAWRFNFGRFGGMSLNEVIKTRVGRSYVANYICGETFQFQFPRHLRLFAELKAWENGGRSLHVNGIWNAVELPTQAHDAYGSYITRRGSSAAASTARGESTEGHGAAAAGDGSIDDDDGTDAIEAATTEDDDDDIATVKWKARLGKAYFRIGSVQEQFLAESVDNLNAGRVACQSYNLTPSILQILHGDVVFKRMMSIRHRSWCSHQPTRIPVTFRDSRARFMARRTRTMCASRGTFAEVAFVGSMSWEFAIVGSSESSAVD